MKAIAIILGDNDFGNTFKPLLASIKRALEYRDLDQDQVEDLIFEGVRFHYLAFQSPGETAQDINKTVAYLLTNACVLFDDEAYTAYVHEDYDSGAWLLNVPENIIEAF